MSTRTTLLRLAALALACGVAAVAAAVVVRYDVTPASVQADPKPFTVDADVRPDGLVRFTITRRTEDDRYVVASLIVRRGTTLIAEGRVPAFVRERTATYHLALAPEYLPDSTFELSENGFAANAADQSDPVPLPGGKHFHVALKDFAPPAKP